MYKIIKNDILIEYQEKLHWVKYQERNNLLISCNENEGQAILAGSYVDNPENPGEQIWSNNSAVYRTAHKPSIGYFAEHDIVSVKYVSAKDIYEDNIQQGIELSEREINEIEQGQEISDHEIRLLELEASLSE